MVTALSESAAGAGPASGGAAAAIAVEAVMTPPASGGAAAAAAEAVMAPMTMPLATESQPRTTTKSFLVYRHDAPAAAEVRGLANTTAVEYFVSWHCDGLSSTKPLNQRDATRFSLVMSAFHACATADEKGKLTAAKGEGDKGRMEVKELAETLQHRFIGRMVKEYQTKAAQDKAKYDRAVQDGAARGEEIPTLPRCLEVPRDLMNFKPLPTSAVENRLKALNKVFPGARVRILSDITQEEILELPKPPENAGPAKKKQKKANGPI